MKQTIITLDDLIKVDAAVYEIPREFRTDMRVPARVFTHEAMLADILQDRSLWQLINVATLPGIVTAAFAMPDIHEGYGFPIGGVAAVDIEQGGVISPGGIGYDINCGVRLLTADITKAELRSYLDKLADELFYAVPSGVGRGGNIILSDAQMKNVLHHGAPYLLKEGYGNERDIEFCEEKGCMSGADPELISQHAKKRGKDQLGTLGSGNHFLEVQYVDEIFDKKVADQFGLVPHAITIMIHCGSRGLGHQTCTDYVKMMMSKLSEWNIILPDRELICAPFASSEGQKYFSAMQAAANFAWANRHMIGHQVRTAWQKVIGNSVELKTVYDLSHNIGKVEEHLINGKKRSLLLHRKGATRSFGPGRLEVPAIYRHVGQPVLIPGTMGTASYVLVGTSESMDIAFGSSCHGSGRTMSRMAAKKTIRGSQLRQELEKKIITLLQQQLCAHHGCTKCHSCLQIHNKQHHGLLWLQPEKNYTIELLEPIFHMLSFMCQPNQKFFFVIPHAETLSTTCANSLLKSLEEPPTGYHFILYAQRQEQLLPTITSRCIITTIATDKAEQEYHELFTFFTQQNSQPDFLAFIQLVDKDVPSEQESMIIVNQILQFWQEKYINVSHDHITNDANYSKYMIDVFRQALLNPPMPGGSKIFWKNLLLKLKKT